MPRLGRRKKIARCIYRDGSGVSVIVRIHGTPHETRFPPGTPLSKLTEKRDALERERKRRQGTGRTSLRASADRYLRDKTGHMATATKQAAKSELDAWCALYGGTSRHELTEQDVLDARDGWLQDGLSPKTINNRTDRLRQLYRALDGKRAWTPVDEIEPLKTHKTPIVWIESSVINAVVETLKAVEEHPAKRLRDAKTRARFMVYASTGRRPSEIMRAEPEDVSLERRVWIPRDGKGGFTPGIYLSDDMLAAWTLFVEAKAWGVFNVNAFTRTIRAAGFPKGVRPYNLRHTVGMTLSEQGTDLADIGPQLGHKRLETTRRHYVPVLHSRMQVMGESLNGRLGWGAGTQPGTAPEVAQNQRDTTTG